MKKSFFAAACILLLGFSIPSQGAFGPSPVPWQEGASWQLDATVGIAEPTFARQNVPGTQGGFSFFINDIQRLCGQVSCSGTWFQIDALFGDPIIRTRLSFETPSFFIWKEAVYITPLALRGLISAHISDEDKSWQLGNTHGLGSTRVGLQGHLRAGPLHVIDFSGGLYAGAEAGYLFVQNTSASLAGINTGIQGKIHLFYPTKHAFSIEGAIEGHFNFLSETMSQARQGITSSVELSYQHALPKSVLRVGVKTFADWWNMSTDVDAPPSTGLSLYAGLFIGVAM